MTVIVFSGPTPSKGQIENELDAVCLPPVSQGDVYRAMALRPTAIGIIDGYFESVPSVWHKEILWAMSQGVHVFGSASMGALRAAELERFGMVGVGAVFEAFRDGVLEEDDEVALIHGPAEDGYRAGSEPMVNIRATLERAAKEGIVGAETAVLLQQTAKELFYAERWYGRILELAAARGAMPADIEAFKSWLPTGAVNQKRDDALAMVRAMREFLACDPGPKTVTYCFENTLHWEGLKRSAGEVAGQMRMADAQVLDQLRLDPEVWKRERAAALGWWLAADRARRQGYSMQASSVLESSAEFCEANGVRNAEDLDRWLACNYCDRRSLESIFEARSVAVREEQQAGADLDIVVLDYLRWNGSYSTLLEKSRKV